MFLRATHTNEQQAWAVKLSLVWLAAMLLLALLGTWFIELIGLPDANAINRACIGGCAPMKSTGAFHLFGTDSLGRDVLSQLIGGARTALFGGLAASGVSFLIGYVLGSWSAWYAKSGRKLSWLVLAEAVLVMTGVSYLYKYAQTPLLLSLILLVVGGIAIGATLRYTKDSTVGIKPDRFLLFLAEVFSSVPALLLLLTLAAMAFRPGLFQLVLIYVFVRWTRFAVLAQQEVKASLASPYVKAAFHAGLPGHQVLWKHILPNTFGTLWVQALLGVSAFIIIEGTFSFLGLGLPVEQASWGRLVSEARSVAGGWWLWVIPGFVLSVTILSLQTVGNSFRQNPKR